MEKGDLSGDRSLEESVGEMRDTSSQVLPWECRLGAGKELHRLCPGAEPEAGSAANREGSGSFRNRVISDGRELTALLLDMFPSSSHELF